MKKFCLFFVLFIFITSVPSFAMKVIVNNKDDRRVPSRCSGSGEEYSIDEYTTSDNNQPMSDYNSYYIMDRYMTYYKPLLSQDMREELIGTTWYYPEYVSKYDYQKVYTQQASDKKSKKVEDKLSKRYLREAADYYILDTLGDNPDRAYPAGFKM